MSIPWLFRHYCTCTTIYYCRLVFSTFFFYYFILLQRLGSGAFTFGRIYSDRPNTCVCVFRFAALDLIQQFLFTSSCFSEIPSLLGENCIIKDDKGPPDWITLGPKKCIQDSRRNGMILHGSTGRIHKGLKQYTWISRADGF